MITNQFQQIKPMSGSNNNDTMTSHYLALINDKYTPEYKIDKGTRQKAEVILHEYFNSFPEDLKVIAVYLICVGRNN